MSEQNGHARQRVDSLVRLLGTHQNTSPHETLRVLHEDGQYAISVLVNELVPIPVDWADREDKQIREKAMHVIWCIRAMRSITGQEFEFKTSLDLTDRQEEFFTQEQELPFFAEWMSHAYIYVAPVDVQENIIKAWRNWIQKHGTSFPVRKFDSDFGAWYF